MDSMYTSASSSSAITSGSVFGSLDEILDEGESGCPAFDRLIQRAENENSELVRLLEEETRKHSALQKELEDANSQREILERSSKSLKEEEKQLQRLAKQNKEIGESLKRTNALLHQHEGTLQKKYEKACSDLQKLQLDNVEVVDKYKGTWDRYYAFYEKSKLAVELANIKKTAMEKQKQASDIEEKIKHMEIQLKEAEKEKKIIEEQQLECETENIDEGLQRKESPKVINEDPSHEENQKNCQIQHSPVVVNINPEKPPPQHQLHSFQGRNQEPISRSVVQPIQKDQSPKQDSFAKEDNSQMLLQSKTPLLQLSNQKKLLNRPFDSPRPTAINTNGLKNYGRFLSPYTHINVPYTFQTSLSPARAPQYQLFNSSSKAPCTSQQSQSWMQDSYNKATSNEVQIVMDNSAPSRDKTHVEQAKVTSQDCEEQMITEDVTPILNASIKSPGLSSNPVSPKTLTTESESSDIFNFTEYSERVRLINKSPGEGFSYPSRRMFDTVENMNEDFDKYETLPKQSLFQPFFATRENEPHQQFTGKSTFFSMDPQSNQENRVQQGQPFHVDREQTSIPNSSNLFSSLTPGEECGTSSGVGFSLFSDQPAANLGRHGNQSPQSPAFSFNFCSSPSLSTENPNNNTGTFNLF
ncbi:uncharacterized protein LOC116297543 [Actinia tenebrosa]|uniref:Uncharacterized protein LOC116297543 n=1 Tax=Actinia tenebrosa TaxID=6105 RepID=A0A6P8HZ37_ACTTE|nr:uncharacterized protein LOC116297543 [Actinia tenebrosa]